MKLVLFRIYTTSQCITGPYLGPNIAIISNVLYNDHLKVFLKISRGLCNHLLNVYLPHLILKSYNINIIVLRLDTIIFNWTNVSLIFSLFFARNCDESANERLPAGNRRWLNLCSIIYARKIVNIFHYCCNTRKPLWVVFLYYYLHICEVN